MIAFLRWILTVICLSTLLTWCFLNRGDVPFDWSPAHDPVPMPLFGVIVLSAMIGFMWGVLVTWLNAAPERAEKRRLKRENKNLKDQLGDTDIATDAAILVSGPRKKWWFK